jgi:multidrug resistance efflux pump
LLEGFSHDVHTKLDPRETAYTIANEGRRLIECDRVSVAILKGTRCKIESVSGQDLFDKRSNTVRLLGDLATAVVTSEEPIWYTGDTSNMAPQVEDAVQEYVDDSHSKTVAVLPLFPPGNEEEEDDPDKREDPPSPIGALIVEQIEDARVPQRMIQRVDVVVKHSATALANSLEHNNLFLMPVWRAIGKARWVLRARTLLKTIAITVAVVAVIVALCVVPYPFKAHCSGTLQPVERRDVFAGLDGEVVDILVEHGTKVVAPDPDTGEEGTLLATLRSTDLNIKMQDIRGKIQSAVEQRRAIFTNLSRSGRMADSDETQIHGQFSELAEHIDSLEKQLKLYEEQMKDLEVRSPIAGEVITWELEDRLRDRPVQKGQVLMQVADTDGAWHIELNMPEKRMGHIDRWLSKLREDDPDANLQVELVMATDPNKTITGHVTEINHRAEARDEEGVTVLIKADFDAGQDLPVENLRPGAEVSAKIMCGPKAVGYVLLCDAIAYFQRNIAFRF